VWEWLGKGRVLGGFDFIPIINPVLFVLCLIKSVCENFSSLNLARTGRVVCYRGDERGVNCLWHVNKFIQKVNFVNRVGPCVVTTFGSL